MYQILYKSNCQIEEEMIPTEIRNILGSAAVNNKRDGITGLFLLVEHQFLQLMEGEESAVKNCLERIKADPRHKDLTVLIQRESEKRLFPKWTMHFSRLSGSEALEKLGAKQLKDLDISHWKKAFNNNLAIMLLESFARLGAM